jgi:hypothetical protein
MPDTKQGSNTMTDEERESLIDTATLLAMHATSPAIHRFWWKVMKMLIADRSAAQVERMEVANGLRAA